MTDSSPLAIGGRAKYKVCRTCGGYGYNMLTTHGNAQRCPSCKGDKISRDPHDYATKAEIPPNPR